MILSRIILTSTFVLIVILGVAASFNSAADGNNVIGFPFVFYTYLGGQRFPEPTARYCFNFFACAIDVMILFGVPFAALLFYQIKQIAKKK